jgi:hypothetical protein
VNAWTKFKKDLSDLYRKSTFAIVALGAGAMLYFWAELSWTSTAIFMFGLYLARLFAIDVLNKWISENISPGAEGGLSRLYPRVWTFSLTLTRPFLNEVRMKLSEKDQADENVSGLNFLDKLVIEEYLNRLSVHVWTIYDGNRDYNMFHIDKSPGNHWNFVKSKGLTLWSFSCEGMNLGELALSCSWERESAPKDPYLQLILWLHYWHQDKQDIPKDTLFKIPLEPRRHTTRMASQYM